MTPKQAKVLRQTANFELQRPLSENNIIRLQAEMEADRFVSGTPIYFAVLPDQTLLALNGNHTLEALGRIQRGIELTMIYQNVKSLAEAAAIYSRFDLQRMRSQRDSLRAHGQEAMLADSPTWTAAFAAAVGLIMNKFTDTSEGGSKDRKFDLVEVQVRRSRDIRLRLMQDALGAANLYAAAIGSNLRGRHLFKRAAVMGVGIEIMRYQPSAGTEFFSTAAADDGLKAGDPQRALLHYLRDHHSAGASMRKLLSRSVSLAWNAFFEGRRLGFVRAGDGGEFRLAGTPWKEGFDPITEYLPDLRSAEKKAKPTLRKIKTGLDSDGNAVAIHA